MESETLVITLQRHQVCQITKHFLAAKKVVMSVYVLHVCGLHLLQLKRPAWMIMSWKRRSYPCSKLYGWQEFCLWFILECVQQSLVCGLNNKISQCKKGPHLDDQPNSLGWKFLLIPMLYGRSIVWPAVGIIEFYKASGHTGSAGDSLCWSSPAKFLCLKCFLFKILDITEGLCVFKMKNLWLNKYGLYLH